MPGSKRSLINSHLIAEKLLPTGTLLIWNNSLRQKRNVLVASQRSLYVNTMCAVLILITTLLYTDNGGAVTVTPLPQVAADVARTLASTHGEPPDRPPKALSDIDKFQQNAHKPGTYENKVRVGRGRTATKWSKPSEADALTLEAYEKGTITEFHPNGAPAEVQWNAGRGVGENGETQITVKLKQNGKMHGFPSGPKQGL